MKSLTLAAAVSAVLCFTAGSASAQHRSHQTNTQRPGSVYHTPTTHTGSSLFGTPPAPRAPAYNGANALGGYAPLGGAGASFPPYTAQVPPARRPPNGR